MSVCWKYGVQDRGCLSVLEIVVDLVSDGSLSLEDGQFGINLLPHCKYLARQPSGETMPSSPRYFDVTAWPDGRREPVQSVG